MVRMVIMQLRQSSAEEGMNECESEGDGEAGREEGVTMQTEND